MITVLLRVVLLVGAVLLGASVLPQLLAHRPDLPLLVVVGVALVRGPWTGVLVGLAAGWLVDLTPPGGEPLAASALSYAAAGALVGRLRGLQRASLLAPVLLTLAAALLVQGVRLVTALAAGADPELVSALWSILLTVTIGLVVVPGVRALETALAGRRRERSTA